MWLKKSMMSLERGQLFYDILSSKITKISQANDALLSFIRLVAALLQGDDGETARLLRTAADAISWRLGAVQGGA
ncbi:hypothetical protein PQR62_05425 [Herbaspirillum lusitanum]|uniref:Uncharacterized protein n=1 Tax=Herbaspirillum lusitanum TaxID=213312 RepID=A0ABW9A639_9BURK